MAIAFVQTAKGSATAAQASATFGATCTTGNLIIVSISQGNVTTIPTVTGYTALTSGAAGSGATSIYTQIFWKISAGTEKIITGSGGGTVNTMVVSEYSGIASVSPVDVENANVAGVSGTTVTTPTLTPTAGLNELLIFSTAIRESVAATWSTEQVNGSATGVNERGDIQPGTGSPAAQLSDLIIASTTGTYSATAVATAGTNNTSAIAMFKATAATVTVSGSTLMMLGVG